MGNPKTSAKFILSPPTLQALASQELALIICRDIARNDIKADSDNGWDLFTRTCKKLAPKIQGVRSPLKKMIKNCLRNLVAQSFSDWCDYHRKSVFYGVPHLYFHNAVLNCIDEFVLNPYGKISYLQTAKNILNSGKLNQVENFKLACINCLVDDIERLWPSVSDNFKVPDERVLKKSPLIGYWTDVMKGEFERLSVKNPHLICNKWGMKILKKSESTAVEYFWNFLSGNGRIAAARVLLSDECDDPSQHHHLFLRCSNDQHLRNILDHCVDWSILSPICARGLNYSEWMLATWNRLKPLISPHEFAAIVESCIKEFNFKQSETCSYMDSVLHEMWISAPDHFRNHILHDRDQIDNIFKAVKPITLSLCRTLPLFRPCRFSMEFFIALLTSIDFSRRNYIWLQFWSDIIVHANLQGLQEMMRLCLSNEEEINRFKKSEMMNLEKIFDLCISLIANGLFSVLAEYLDFCSSKKHRVVKLKRKILQSSAMQSAIARNINDWGKKKLANFHNFVDDAFPNKEDADKYVRLVFEKSREPRTGSIFDD